MAFVYLLTGSNLENSYNQLARAESLIHENLGKVTKKSSVYSTAPWGNLNQPNFLNQVIEIQTSFSPYTLMSEILKIEESLGRVRNEKWGPRIIDIDILFYDNEVISGNLTIPHPLMAQRKFVLIPLNELASSFVHPVHQKTISQLLIECQDNGNVELYNPIN